MGLVDVCRLSHQVSGPRRLALFRNRYAWAGPGQSSRAEDTVQRENFAFFQSQDLSNPARLKLHHLIGHFQIH